MARPATLSAWPTLSPLVDAHSLSPCPGRDGTPARLPAASLSYYAGSAGSFIRPLRTRSAGTDRRARGGESRSGAAEHQSAAGNRATLWGRSERGRDCPGAGLAHWHGQIASQSCAGTPARFLAGRKGVVVDYVPEKCTYQSRRD